MPVYRLNVHSRATFQRKCTKSYFCRNNAQLAGSPRKFSADYHVHRQTAYCSSRGATVFFVVSVVEGEAVLPPRWDTAYLRYAVRQVEMTGFYLFDGCHLLQRKLVDALDFRTRWQIGSAAPCNPGFCSVLDNFFEYCTIMYFETLMRH